MKTVKPIPSMTINIEGEETVLLRQEMLNDSVLGDILTNYEKLLGEVATLEYEIAKAAHARRSMQSELQQKAIEYVQNKNKVKKEASENKEE